MLLSQITETTFRVAIRNPDRCGVIGTFNSLLKTRFVGKIANVRRKVPNTWTTTLAAMSIRSSTAMRLKTLKIACVLPRNGASFMFQTTLCSQPVQEVTRNILKTKPCCCSQTQLTICFGTRRGIQNSRSFTNLQEVGVRNKRQRT